jgi:transposase-like protein
MKQPKTLQEAIRYFSNEQTCIETVAAMRWANGKPVCPACEHTEHYYLGTQKRWKCKECGRQFSVKLNTIFEDSPIPLDKWLTAMWMIANCKNGVSSYEIHRAIGVTQKSAWFMMHRIRLAMKDSSDVKLGGGTAGTATPVEVDETFIGGKARNMHKSRKISLERMKTAGLKNETKAIVAGVIDRKKGKVRAQVVPIRNLENLDAFVRKNVLIGSVVYTDDFQGYDNLRSRFAPDKINKQVEGYIKGKIHTQGIENFWSLLKRGLGGTYIAVEPFHLDRYLDEQVFRYNNRKDGERKVSDYERFTLALGQVTGRRLTFAEVTGKVGETTH